MFLIRFISRLNRSYWEENGWLNIKICKIKHIVHLGMKGCICHFIKWQLTLSYPRGRYIGNCFPFEVVGRDSDAQILKNQCSALSVKLWFWSTWNHSAVHGLMWMRITRQADTDTWGVYLRLGSPERQFVQIHGSPAIAVTGSGRGCHGSGVHSTRPLAQELFAAHLHGDRAWPVSGRGLDPGFLAACRPVVVTTMLLHDDSGGWELFQGIFQI